ncbi:MAG: hypothetical protein IPN94_15845 [Sphingobacteriales bacterium]|nr:hypothetical protein [Sphingobacteriales bacterium]
MPVLVRTVCEGFGIKIFVCATRLCSATKHLPNGVGDAFEVSAIVELPNAVLITGILFYADEPNRAKIPPVKSR